MASKLFKNTEDQMKEAMLFGDTPVGKDIKALLTAISHEPVDPLYWAHYKAVRAYDCPRSELLF